MAAIIFDIETRCLPLSDLIALHGPFDAKQYSHPGEFDPDSVRTGNLGPAKAAEKIAAKRTEHEAAVTKYQQMLVDKQVEYEASLMNSAALCAGTGRVVAIGYMLHDGRVMIDDGDDGGEPQLIKNFWNLLQGSHTKGGSDRYIGHCCHSFDLPFLVRRSWILGVDFPSWVLDKNRYWHPMLVDTAAVWGCGVWNDRITLDMLSAYFDGPRKNGDGADFARKWKEDREAAITYLRRDLECTHHVARSLRLFDGFMEDSGAAGSNGRHGTTPAAPVAQSEKPKSLRSSTNAKSANGDVDHARELIDEIMRLVDELPGEAEDFGLSASDTARSISVYIDERDRVTVKQVNALENIISGLGKWVRA